MPTHKLVFEEVQAEARDLCLGDDICYWSMIGNYPHQVWRRVTAIVSRDSYEVVVRVDPPVTSRVRDRWWQRRRTVGTDLATFAPDDTVRVRVTRRVPV